MGLKKHCNIKVDVVVVVEPSRESYSVELSCELRWVKSNRVTSVNLREKNHTHIVCIRATWKNVKITKSCVRVFEWGEYVCLSLIMYVHILCSVCIMSHVCVCVFPSQSHSYRISSTLCVLSSFSLFSLLHSPSSSSFSLFHSLPLCLWIFLSIFQSANKHWFPCRYFCIFYKSNDENNVFAGVKQFPSRRLTVWIRMRRVKTHTHTFMGIKTSERESERP